MNVKDAVKAAKIYVADLFSEEGLINLGLEEIEHNDADGTWDVTLGFSRPWNAVHNTLTALTGEPPPKRAYRVVKVRDDGEVLSIKRRDGQE